MMTSYQLEGGGVRPCDAPAAAPDAVWIDLHNPTEEEANLATAILGFAPPTRAEQQEIELSSRLYMHDGVAVMTTLLPAHTDTDQAEMGPVTFILSDDRLITLRHHDPRPFSTFPKRSARSALACASPVCVLLGLIEDVIGRLADLMEYAGRKIEQLTRQVFYPLEGQKPDLQKRLYKIGWRDALVTHIRDSLVTLERLLSFLEPLNNHWAGHAEVNDFIVTQQRDIRTLSEQAGFLMQKTAFLLDAMMGLINIEQSTITKMFSIVAVVFLPPTLVASVYGMNFALMPELQLPFGYPTALILMVVSAVLPLMYFKRKGWF